MQKLNKSNLYSSKAFIYSVNLPSMMTYSKPSFVPFMLKGFSMQINNINIIVDLC